MRYLGGKSRLAKDICREILSRTTEREVYIEPFLGGGATFQVIAPNFKFAIGTDIQEDLMLMWQAVLDGSLVLPDHISESDYKELRHAEPSALRGFVGFGMSFGGGFFEGYARKARGVDDDSYLRSSERSVLKFRDSLIETRVRLGRKSFDELFPKDGSVVYCDPPYAGTKEYSQASGFDHGRFWSTMDKWAENGAHVFVSEFSAPDHWTPVWEKERKIMTKHVDNAGDRPVKVDRLFVHRDSGLC